MLTISKMYNTLKKYEMDNYYLGENAPKVEFSGEISNKLGLKFISGGAFENIVAGKNINGEMLVRPGISGKHNPGRDVVLSPDKSVALSCYLSQNPDDRRKIIEAHREAVKCVAGYIEKDLILARIDHGRAGIERICTGNMLYTEFEHNTSRELDPQLHTHLIIFNITGLPGGSFKAMENRNVYDCRKLLCRIYENQLCRSMRSHGFDAGISKEGYAQIEGVDNKIRDLFSKRTVNMKEKLKRYFEAKGINPADEINKGNTKGLEKAIMLYTRKPKKAVDLDKIISEWKKELAGMGKSERDIPESRGIELFKNIHENSPEKYIQMALDEVTQARGFFSKKDILSHSLSLSKAEFDIKELEKAFYNNRNLIILEKQARIGCGYHTAYTTPGIIETEKNNLLHALKWRQDFKPEYKEDGACKAAADYFFTPEQNKTFRELLISGDRMDLLKSEGAGNRYFLLPALIRAYREKGYDTVLIAPDGRNARSLEAAVNIEVLSPDRFLSQNRRENGEKTLYIADRLDLIGPVKIGKIMDRADFANSKIVFTGEFYRTGREAGRDFRNFCLALNKFDIAGDVTGHERHYKIPEHELLKLREHSSLITESALYKLEKNASLKTGYKTGELKYSICRDYLKDPQNSVVLTRSWREKNELNLFIRENLEKAGTVENSARIAVRSGDVFGGQAGLKKDSGNYEKGQRISALNNVRGMKKGETGTVIDVDPGTSSVKVAIDSSRRHAVINPSKDYKKYRVEELRETYFGRGDRIVFLKSAAETGIKRGECAIVKEIGENKIRAVLDNQRSIEFDYKKHNFFDHAYAAMSLDSISERGKNVLLDLRAGAGRPYLGPEIENCLRSLKPGMRIYTDNIEYVKTKMEEINFNDFKLSYENNKFMAVEKIKAVERECRSIRYEKSLERSRSMQWGIGM